MFMTSHSQKSRGPDPDLLALLVVRINGYFTDTSDSYNLFEIDHFTRFNKISCD